MAKIMKFNKNRLITFVNKIKNSVIFISIVSFFWLLWRSGTKPSRIVYPCQRAAAINVGMAAYFFPLIYCHKVVGFFKYRFDLKKLLKYCFSITIAVLLLSVATITFDNFQLENAWNEYHSTNNGIFGKNLDYNGISTTDSYESIPSALALESPHRVVSVHNSNASSWTGSGSPRNYLNQNEIDRMIRSGIKTLTGKTDYIEAWQELMPYSEGEAVAIKLNFNNVNAWDENPCLNPYAELVNSIIDGLIGLGVPGEKIWLTDPSRKINDDFRNGIVNQDVLFFTSPTYDPGGRERVFRTSYVAEGSPDASWADFHDEGLTAIMPAQVLVDADHIINVPMLKGHTGPSFTFGLKNHYGSAVIGTQSRSYWHKYFCFGYPECGLGPNPVIEINRNPHIQNKTRLILGDGVYGHPESNDPSCPDYRMLFQSFNNNPPEILFFGVDPIAVESVMFDYLQWECELRSFSPRVDDMLIEAATLGMGVHEHWNNNDDREYTVIDYIELEIDGEDNTPPIISNPIPANGATDIELNPDLSITVNDFEGNIMDITWWSNSSGPWTIFGTNNSVYNGTYHQKNMNFNSYNTKYWWSVHCTDGYNWNNKTYSFTTRKYNFLLNNEYPLNNSIDIDRPPLGLSINVENPNGDPMDLYFRWKNHEGQWDTLDTFYGTGNGIYNYIIPVPPDTNNWIWGDTIYLWSVNLTDGSTWVNESYNYRTDGSRYDVNNNDLVNFQDAGIVWVHRTGETAYDSLYDVNNDSQVNFQDAGLTWAFRE